MRRLVGGDKGRDIAYQLPSQARRTRHGENSFNLLPKKHRQTLKQHPSSFPPRLNSTPPDSSTPPPLSGIGGIGGWGHYGQDAAVPLCHCFPLTLFSCSGGGSPQRPLFFRKNVVSSMGSSLGCSICSGTMKHLLLLLLL